MPPKHPGGLLKKQKTMQEKEGGLSYDKITDQEELVYISHSECLQILFSNPNKELFFQQQKAYYDEITQQNIQIKKSMRHKRK